MDHALIIGSLGGATAFARLIGRHPSRPIRWKSEGIPRSVWPEVIRIAADVGKHEITFEALMAGEPRKGEAA